MNYSLSKTVVLFSIIGVLLSPFYITAPSLDGGFLSFHTKYTSAQGANLPPECTDGDPNTECTQETRDAASASLQDHDCGWTDWTCYIGKGAIFFLSLAGKATQLTANVMDAALLFSLSLGHDEHSGIMEGVEAGWETFRDLANLVFIFALLYIAIATILQLSNFDTKRTLGMLIVVGLLINFSLFATKIVIDTSNVLGCFFYERVTVVGGGGTAVSCADAANLSSAEFWNNKGIGAVFANQTKITSLYNIPEGTEANEFFDGYNLAIIGFFGTVFLLILAFVFLMGAVLFIMRSVALLFLMALSPLAFIGFALPYTSGAAKNWWNKLISYSFVAPIFLVLIFVVMQVMLKVGAVIGNDSETVGFSSGFVESLASNSVGSIGVIFNFLLVIGLTIAAIVVSKNFGDQLGSASINIAQRATRWTGKNTAGNLGTFMRWSGSRIQNTSPTTGRALRSMGTRLETKSYDVARAPGAKQLSGQTGMQPLEESKTMAQKGGEFMTALSVSGKQLKEEFDAAKGKDSKESYFKNLSNKKQEQLYKEMSPNERAELLSKDARMRSRIQELDDKLPHEEREKTQELRGKKESTELREALNRLVDETKDEEISEAIASLAKDRTGKENDEDAIKALVGKMTDNDVAKIDSKAITESIIKGMNKTQFRKFASEAKYDDDNIEMIKNVYKETGNSHPVKQEIQFGGNKIYQAIKQSAANEAISNEQRQKQSEQTRSLGSSVIDTSSNVEKAKSERPDSGQNNEHLNNPSADK